VSKNSAHPLLLLLILSLSIGTAGCGQRSGLYMPSEDEARNRASLPQIMNPVSPSSKATNNSKETTPIENPTISNSPRKLNSTDTAPK